MSEQREHHLVRGILAGVAGGLAASWAQNRVMGGPRPPRDPRGTAHTEQQPSAKQSGESEDATMKAADALLHAATRGRHLSWSGRETGGAVVHYSFGAVVGGLYGGLAEYSRSIRSGFGLNFGTLLFIGADIIGVPAVRLAPPITEQSPTSFVAPLAAHLVYAITTELVRRGVRTAL